MNSNIINDYESFSKNKFLHGLNSVEIKNLYAITRSIILKKGDELYRKGDPAEELYFITDGILEILIREPSEKRSHILHTVSSGEIVGESSFLDNTTRSDSVRAKTKATLRGLLFSDLEKHMNSSHYFPHISVNLAKQISFNLRSINKETISVLKRGERERRKRILMETFLLYTIFCLCFLVISLIAIRDLIKSYSSSTDYALIFSLISAAAVVGLATKSKLSWSAFGIHLKNWRRAVLEGSLAALGIMAILFILKWIVIHYSYSSHALFEPFAGIYNPKFQTWGYWLLLNACYCFIIAPLQELLVRGIMQGLLEHLLDGKHKALLSILMSNLIFGSTHLFFSFELALIAFFTGIIPGWIYFRTRNLIAPIIPHVIGGVWGLSILGSPF